MNSIGPRQDSNVPAQSLDANQEVPKGEEKLAKASARKLAKNVLNGKADESGNIKTKSLGTHQARTLVDQIQTKKTTEDEREPGLGTLGRKVAHISQRVKNLFTAGHFKTNMQMLEKAESLFCVTPVTSIPKDAKPTPLTSGAVAHKFCLYGEDPNNLAGNVDRVYVDTKHGFAYCADTVGHNFTEAEITRSPAKKKQIDAAWEDFEGTVPFEGTDPVSLFGDGVNFDEVLNQKIGKMHVHFEEKLTKSSTLTTMAVRSTEKTTYISSTAIGDSKLVAFSVKGNKRVSTVTISGPGSPTGTKLNQGAELGTTIKDRATVHYALPVDETVTTIPLLLTDGVFESFVTPDPYNEHDKHDRKLQEAFLNEVFDEVLAEFPNGIPTDEAGGNRFMQRLADHFQTKALENSKKLVKLERLTENKLDDCSVCGVVIHGKKVGEQTGVAPAQSAAPQGVARDPALAEVHTKLFAGDVGQPLPVDSVEGLYVGKGRIDIGKFPGKLVAINSAHETLKGEGTSGTNRALYEASDPKEWDRIASKALGRGPFKRSMKVGDVIQGPKVNGDDDFTMLHLKAPKLASNTTSADLPRYKEQVLNGYKNAFSAAKEAGARFVQAPLISTQAFAKSLTPELLNEWTDMVRSAFIEAAKEAIVPGEFEICMLEYDANDPGTVEGMKTLATGKEMVAFYKDGPTACFGNFFTVPGGFNLDGKTYHNVEAALHHGKWMNAAACADPADGDKLLNDPLFTRLQGCEKGTDALKLGRELEKKYPDLLKNSADSWHGGVKQKLVWNALKAKFSQDPLKSMLKATGTSYLLEHKAAEQARDNYWSDGGDGSGVNALGKMLMAIRDGKDMPDLVIDPNSTEYVRDKEVESYAGAATTKNLGYSVYGKGGGVPRPQEEMVQEETAYDLQMAARQKDIAQNLEGEDLSRSVHELMVNLEDFEKEKEIIALAKDQAYYPEQTSDGDMAFLENKPEGAWFVRPHSTDENTITIVYQKKNGDQLELVKFQINKTDEAIADALSQLNLTADNAITKAAVQRERSDTLFESEAELELGDRGNEAKGGIREFNQAERAYAEVAEDKLSPDVQENRRLISEIKLTLESAVEAIKRKNLADLSKNIEQLEALKSKVDVKDKYANDLEERIGRLRKAQSELQQAPLVPNEVQGSKPSLLSKVQGKMARIKKSTNPNVNEKSSALESLRPTSSVAKQRAVIAKLDAIAFDTEAKLKSALQAGGAAILKKPGDGEYELFIYKPENGINIARSNQYRITVNSEGRVVRQDSTFSYPTFEAAVIDLTNLTDGYKMIIDARNINTN